MHAPDFQPRRGRNSQDFLRYRHLITGVRGVIFLVLESRGLNSQERGIFIMAMSFDPFSELDRLTGNLLQFRPGARFMPVDLYRDEEQYILTADLPGVDPGSVDVDVDGQTLTIRADRTEAGHDSVKWVTQERADGSYP